jgi:hypothetical protein
MSRTRNGGSHKRAVTELRLKRTGLPDPLDSILEGLLNRYPGLHLVLDFFAQMR